jgi:hypothetical protein
LADGVGKLEAWTSLLADDVGLPFPEWSRHVNA